jgi:K+-transporting ATPase ATPase C chain
MNTVNARVKTLQAAESTNKTAVPVDLVTASASGLDPHISVAAAEYQLKRVAKARNMDENKLRELVSAQTETRQWFILGEPRINVLQLNLALDQATH